MKSHSLWSFTRTVLRTHGGFSTAQKREAFGSDGLREEITGNSMEGEAMGNEKRYRVRTSSLQSCRSQLTISCGIDGDFFCTTFLEVLGKILWVIKEAGRAGE